MTEGTDALDQIIVDALDGIGYARKAVPVLAAVDPAIAAIAEPVLTLLWEGLATLRDERARLTEDEIRSKLQAAITATTQQLAAAKFAEPTA